MEPDAQFHRVWLTSEGPYRIELGQAVGNVVEVVVMPMGLGVHGNQFVVNGKWIAFGSDPAPELSPAIWSQFIHLEVLAAADKRPRAHTCARFSANQWDRSNL